MKIAIALLVPIISSADTITEPISGHYGDSWSGEPSTVNVLDWIHIPSFDPGLGEPISANLSIAMTATVVADQINPLDIDQHYVWASAASLMAGPSWSLTERSDQSSAPHDVTLLPQSFTEETDIINVAVSVDILGSALLDFLADPEFFIYLTASSATPYGGGLASFEVSGQVSYELSWSDPVGVPAPDTGSTIWMAGLSMGMLLGTTSLLNQRRLT